MVDQRIRHEIGNVTLDQVGHTASPPHISAAVSHAIAETYLSTGFSTTLVIGLLLVALAVALTVLRVKVITSAAFLIEPDEIAYYAAWQRVISKADQQPDRSPGWLPQ